MILINQMNVAGIALVITELGCKQSGTDGCVKSPALAEPPCVAIFDTCALEFALPALVFGFKVVVTCGEVESEVVSAEHVQKVFLVMLAEIPASADVPLEHLPCAVVAAVDPPGEGVIAEEAELLSDGNFVTNVGSDQQNGEEVGLYCDKGLADVFCRIGRCTGEGIYQVVVVHVEGFGCGAVGNCIVVFHIDVVRKDGSLRSARQGVHLGCAVVNRKFVFTCG